MSDQLGPLPDLTAAGGAGQQPAVNRGRRRQPRGSWAVRNNFARMEREFGTGAGAGAGAGAVGTSVLDRHDGATRPPVTDQKPLVESDVLGKVGLLTLIAIGAGGLSFLFTAAIGFALICVVVAFGLAIWTVFRPRMARTLAPVYAVVEGLALGVLSRLYDAQSHGIVPLAIILTGALFMGVLIAYRTGLVRVSNRFISMTVVASFALLAVMVAVIFGLSFPGLGGSTTTLLVFGVLYVAIAIMDLFVDFELVSRAAKAGVPADAEWYAAFSIFLAVVMLYLGLLRILGGMRR